MIKCIIIDDEPYALDLMKDYVAKTPFLELSAAFSNPLKAVDFLNTNKVDLILLDVNMPDLSGIDFIKVINPGTAVIFTTAYPEYAVESYDIGAIDYLLKPIKYDRFLKAVNKFRQSAPENSRQQLTIKSGNKHYLVDLNDILYIESSGNYMIFHLKENKIISQITMKEIEQLLPLSTFMRVHKSFIVAINKIEIVDKTSIIIAGKSIPIGLKFKEPFFSTLIHKKP